MVWYDRSFGSDSGFSQNTNVIYFKRMKFWFYIGFFFCGSDLDSFLWIY